ncbi:MAG: ABC transporter substrate-binding protein [Saprospiraceae bacterium]|nr:ABC transporter substrate-binding protein [Saprospiraceae bacterium]
MPVFLDQMHREVDLPVWPPRRIVSLVPSQTELLYDLGLGDRVVGITKFCIHPAAWYAEKKRVGGTKTVNFAKIEALQPDLIIGNKEENEKAQIETLAEKYPVWLSDVPDLQNAYDMMLRVGELSGQSEAAQALVDDIRRGFAPLLHAHLPAPRARVAYFIWRKPWMAAGAGTFIDAMLRAAGFDNVFADRERYPEISVETLAKAAPEHLFLSSEPYPFAEKHFAAFREVCPGASIRVVDGEMFSWYGSRLKHAPAYLTSLQKAIFEQK